MGKTQRSETKRFTPVRSGKWTAGTLAMLLSASLILAACGGDSEDPVAEATVVPTMAAPAANDAANTPEAEDDAEAESTEVVASETAVLTETDVTTTTEVITETDVVTDVDTTIVTTDTVVSTDTDSDTETGTETETEVITDSTNMTGTGTSTGTEGATSSEVVTGTGTSNATGTATAGMGVSGIEDQYVRASSLLDYDFENMDGEVSGDLEDLIIDLSTGRVLFASIEYGGVLDLGDKDIVVPLNAFANGEEDELVLNIDEAALESYPDVGNDWPNLEDPAWDDDVNAFWGDTGIEVGEGFNEATTSVARASELIGHNTGDLGNGAGSILDILVNLGTGQAPYLIVDNGEGLDTDPYIIPMAAFDVTDWRTELAYGPDFTPDMLENAPRFDQDAYPEGSAFDQEFGDNIESTWNDLGFDND